MTAPVARYAIGMDHDLLGDYIGFCKELRISDRALRDRLRAARAFLAAHPDLDVWMTRPVPARLADLRRTAAWPLVGWAVLTGRLHADLGLLLVKDFGTLGAAAAQLFPGDFAAARGGSPRRSGPAAGRRVSSTRMSSRGSLGALGASRPAGSCDRFGERATGR